MPSRTSAAVLRAPKPESMGCWGVAMPPSLGPGVSVSASSVSPKPRRCATAAASVRLRTSSLARIRETCTLAVFSAM